LSNSSINYALASFISVQGNYVKNAMSRPLRFLPLQGEWRWQLLTLHDSPRVQKRAAMTQWLLIRHGAASQNSLCLLHANVGLKSLKRQNQ